MAKSKIKLDDNNDGHKEILFDLMNKKGIGKLLVYFDGGGDDGQVNNIEAVDLGGCQYDASGKNWKNWKKLSGTVVEGAMLKQHCGWHNGKESYFWQEKVTVEELVYDLCYRVLNTNFGGWENDDGACGEFVIDAQKRKAELTMKQRYYEYDVSLHEL